MSSQITPGPYLTASTGEGMLIIHSSPITLSWVPRDAINNAYNVGGTVTVGTFDQVDDAKLAAGKQYSVSSEEWHVADMLPFDMESRAETHTPEIDGHKIVRHGIRWK